MRGYELRGLALAVLLAAAILAVALLQTLGALIMRYRNVLLAAALALGLSGCAGLGGSGGAGSQVLQNLEHCDRHYEGAIGAGINGSFRIDCKAQPLAPAASAEPAA